MKILIRDTRHAIHDRHSRTITCSDFMAILGKRLFFFFQHTCLIEQTSFGFCNSTLFLATVGWVKDGRKTLNSKLENSDFLQCDGYFCLIFTHIPHKGNDRRS